MKYIYLDNNFYNRHPQINYPEILQKKVQLNIVRNKNGYSL